MTVESETKDKVTLDLVDRILNKLKDNADLTEENKKQLCPNGHIGEKGYKHMYRCMRGNEPCPYGMQLEYQGSQEELRGQKYCNIRIVLYHKQKALEKNAKKN